MLPDLKAGPEVLFMRSAALVVAEAISKEQGASLAGCTETQLLASLDDPDIARAVDAEVSRMRLSGDLASLKAARLTDTMLDKLLSTPDEEINVSLAMRLAELGLKFREKPTAAGKQEAHKARVVILKDGDPDLRPDPDGGFLLTIDMRSKRTQTVQHEEISDAE